MEFDSIRRSIVFDENDRAYMEAKLPVELPVKYAMSFGIDLVEAGQELQDQTYKDFGIDPQTVEPDASRPVNLLALKHMKIGRQLFNIGFENDL